MEVQVLFEVGKSREILTVSNSASLEAAIKSRLPSCSSSSSPKLLPFDNCPRDKGKYYILQKWSERWHCYVDATNKEVEDGAKLTVIECDGCGVSQII